MNKSWLICIACLALAAGLMVWGLSGQSVSPASPEYFYALLADDLGTEVLQFKHGAQEAATGLGAGIGFLTVARNQPLEQAYLEKLEEVAEARPDGVILPAGAEGALPRALEIGKALSIPVICLFETADDGAVSVITNFRACGAMMAESALAQGDLQRPVALLAGEPQEERMLEGLQSKLGDVEALRCSDEGDLAARVKALPPEACLFALNPRFTLALAEHGGGRRLWGIDPGDKRVELLEEGATRGLAFQMPYAQGYQAVMAAHEHRLEHRVIEVPSRVVTKDTMYLSENVKLIFPLLQ